jgi:hypothetical protein
VRKSIPLGLILFVWICFSWSRIPGAGANQGKLLYRQNAVLEACALGFGRKRVDALLRQGAKEYIRRHGVGSAPCFQRLLDELTLAEFEGPSLKIKLGRWQDLPFPVLWAILDRAEPLQSSYLDPSDFCDLKVERPRDESLRDKVAARFLKENEERIERLRSRRAGPGPFDASTDYLVYLKIALVELIGKRLAGLPPEWPDGWKERVIAELERRAAVDPSSIQDWYLAESYREALARVPGRSSEAGPSVWDSPPFIRWWAEHGAD